MRSDWETLSLRDAGVTLIDCDHRTPKETEDGYPYITIPQLSDGHIRASEARRISHADFVEWTKKLLPREHDVIVVRRCSSGDSAVIPRGLDCAIGQNLVVLRADGKSVAPQYLRWLVRGAEWWEEVRKYLNVGAVFDSLKCRDIPNFELPIPPLDSQSRIACLLNALDDRIDHNRALAANLEAIARALFKSWFVDFDPVRTKASGETPPGLAPDLVALFPDRFVDSELGEIPQGWNVVALSQLIEVERGLSYKGSGLADRESGKPMHNLNSVLEGGGYKYSGIKYYSGDYKARHFAKAGDIVVANTEQGHKHLLIGFPAIIPASHEEGLFSHHLYRVRLLHDAQATSNWLYYALMAPDVREQIIGHANGSTVNMLKPTGLQVPLVVLPPLKLCEHFEALAVSIRARIENCVAESAALTQIRDLLLPRLISGKLRVEDAEAELEAA